jgi:hypothetical protein
LDNNHWSCIKIGLQITQDLDEFLDEFFILYERMKMLLWVVGELCWFFIFFIVGFLGVLKSCCEKENIYL